TLVALVLNVRVDADPDGRVHTHCGWRLDVEGDDRWQETDADAETLVIGILGATGAEQAQGAGATWQWAGRGIGGKYVHNTVRAQLPAVLAAYYKRGAAGFADCQRCRHNEFKCQYNSFLHTYSPSFNKF